MDEIIKKKLARNWFKTLQEVLCKEIEELEGGSKLFKYKNLQFYEDLLQAKLNEMNNS